MCIITELYGGLGNQMFQYAAGRALAHRLQIPLKLDLSRFEDYKLRSYKLNHFDIEEDVATRDDKEPFLIPEKGVSLFVYRVKNFFLKRHQKNIFIEKNSGYDEDFDKISGSCWLKGYWQSEKYFKNIEEIIRKEFTLLENPNEVNQEFLKEIKKASSVSVHVRRGDYIHNSATNQFHGFLGEKYYKKAIKHFESRIKSPVFFVFSDDIEWARDHLRANYPMIFIDHNGVEKDVEDLRLMQNCKYHIIANSSFSWWAAWLSTHPGKKVVAPGQWFTKKVMKKSERVEIIPPEWTRI